MPTREDHELSRLITPVINTLEISQLNSVPQEQKVHDVFKSIDVDSSPGPDGFGSLFYSHCWDIIKKDVMGVVLDFFQGTELSRF